MLRTIVLALVLFPIQARADASAPEMIAQRSCEWGCWRKLVRIPPGGLTLRIPVDDAAACQVWARGWFDFDLSVGTHHARSQVPARGFGSIEARLQLPRGTHRRLTVHADNDSDRVLVEQLTIDCS